MGIPTGVRRIPFTLGYGVLLLGTGIWLSLATPGEADRYEQAISTNLNNLATRPGQVLLLSLSATDASYRWLFLALVLVALGVCETWLGTWRTIAVYVGSNIVVTLAVAGWLNQRLASGEFDPGIRSVSDYGVSYGLNTVLALLAARPRRLWANALMAALAVGWLLLQDPWGFQSQAEYFGLGHILATGLGLMLAAGVLVRRKIRGSSDSDARAASTHAVPS